MPIEREMVQIKGKNESVWIPTPFEPDDNIASLVRGLYPSTTIYVNYFKQVIIAIPHSGASESLPSPRHISGAIILYSPKGDSSKNIPF